MMALDASSIIVSGSKYLPRFKDPEILVDDEDELDA
jgi:hypothetical protein